MRREQKEKEVELLSERVENAKTLIFTDYRGLKVSEMDELRSELKKEDSTFKVVKNRLAKRVLKAAGLDSLMDHFNGPTAIASSDSDPVSPAKVLVKFAKDHGKLDFKGGYMQGEALEIDDIKNLASMPSRDELYAKGLSSMMAPANNLVGALAAMPRKLVYALNAIKDTKQE